MIKTLFVTNTPSEPDPIKQRLTNIEKGKLSIKHLQNNFVETLYITSLQSFQVK